MKNIVKLSDTIVAIVSLTEEMAVDIKCRAKHRNL